MGLFCWCPSSTHSPAGKGSCARGAFSTRAGAAGCGAGSWYVLECWVQAVSSMPATNRDMRLRLALSVIFPKTLQYPGKICQQGWPALPSRREVHKNLSGRHAPRGRTVARLRSCGFPRDGRAPPPAKRAPGTRAGSGETEFPEATDLGREGGTRRNGGGAEGNRTPDLLIANEALSQLSYSPIPPASPGRQAARAGGTCAERSAKSSVLAHVLRADVAHRPCPG